MGKIVLELPEPPNVANRRIHWAAKRLYRNQAWAYARSKVQRTHPIPEKVRVSLHFRLWALMDEDNLVARCKLPIDALKGEYFIDDDPAHMELGEVTQEVNRKDRGVTVSVEVVEAEQKENTDEIQDR